MLEEVFKDRRILVTGHTGFKGSWLSLWLTRLKAQTAGMALAPGEDQPLFGQLQLNRRLSGDYRVDIRDRRAVAAVVERVAPEFIFHLAAQPLVRRSYEAPDETFDVNVQGTVNLLEAVRQGGRPCVVVVATTDKCYENRGWIHGYREEDPLGGYDPYSASKACAELAVASYRQSFGTRAGRAKLATVRAGNVIGGGDWARDRIVPDCIRALRRNEPIAVRNKTATRPWQHVLEPLAGYLCLAAALDQPHRWGHDDASAFCGPFNFGPALGSNRTVAELVEALLTHLPGRWVDKCDPHAPHEASRLNLATDKAFHMLKWRPVWDFSETVRRTAEWYRAEGQGADVCRMTNQQISDYQQASGLAATATARAA